jgi:YVTN family beta-propeller protein
MMCLTARDVFVGGRTMMRSTGLLDHGWPVVVILTLLAGATLGLIPGDQANAAWGIAVNPETGKLYVPCYKSGDIYVIDTATLDLQTDIALGSGPDWELAMMAIDPSQQNIFVASHARNALVLVSDSATYRMADANGRHMERCRGSRPETRLRHQP